MKILHINSYFNGSKFYKNFYEKQIEMGLNIKVYVPVPLNTKLDKQDWGKYTLVSPVYRKYDRLFYHLKHFKIYKDIVRKINIKDYSIVHAHSLFSNVYIA